VETDYGLILIVDEDAPFRELVRIVLEGAGYATVEAETGEAALEIAAKEQPSLVLLDVRLPGISGYEVCRQLRERYGRDLPIVFLSGSRTDPHDQAAGLMIGADEYLIKPFLPDELVALVGELLARAGAEQPLEQPEANGLTGWARLTARELEVLQLLSRGFTQKTIAGELHISRKTVAMHIQRILGKLGVHSRAAAVSRAYRLGLVRAEVESHRLVDK